MEVRKIRLGSGRAADLVVLIVDRPRRMATGMLVIGGVHRPCECLRWWFDDSDEHRKADPDGDYLTVHVRGRRPTDDILDDAEEVIFSEAVELLVPSLPR